MMTSTWTCVRYFFLSTFILFFTTALSAKGEVSKGEDKTVKDTLALGKVNSPMEIYIISDWLCSSCRKMEPKFKAIYNNLKSKAAFFFIDYPLHRKSANFTPYHLSFLKNEKPKYFDAREALLNLTDQTEDPRDEDVVKLVEEHSLRFKELSFSEIAEGSQFFEDVLKKYDVRATPTVVVVNSTTGKFEKFVGSQIKEKTIRDTFRKLKK